MCCSCKLLIHFFLGMVMEEEGLGSRNHSKNLTAKIQSKALETKTFLAKVKVNFNSSAAMLLKRKKKEKFDVVTDNLEEGKVKKKKWAEVLPNTVVAVAASCISMERLVAVRCWTTIMSIIINYFPLYLYFHWFFFLFCWCYEPVWWNVPLWDE